MAKFSLEKQTYEVPGSRVPGSTGNFYTSSNKFGCLFVSLYDLYMVIYSTSNNSIKA